MKLYALRPSFKNPKLWFPERPPKSTWDKLREKMLVRDDCTCRFCGHRSEQFMQAHHLNGSDDNSLKNLVTCCVACHAVNHVGRNMQLGVIEVWRSTISQLEIVRTTRSGIKAGKTLAQINKRLNLDEGPLSPSSIAKSVIKSSEYTFTLVEPLSVVFVALQRWQT